MANDRAEMMSQANRMFDKFKRNYPILTDKWESFINYFHRIEVSAGTVLIEEGEIAKKIFLIEKGCVRAWINPNGRDVTFQFFFENEVVSSVESFLKHVPGFFTIETIEPCVLHWIHKKDWTLIMDIVSQMPDMKDKAIEAALERQHQYMSQFISFIKDSPKQRYLSLLKEKPHVIQRVPLKYIATYLRITPVSLSRIRKKVGKNYR